MAGRSPTTELEPKFSDPSATPTPWVEARDRLAVAQTYWLATVRPDGRPHVTTIAAIWLDDALYFTTGITERKAHNLETNAAVVVTTGNNGFEGLDVVVEGEAVRLTDPTRLQRLADAYIEKYGEVFVFNPTEGGYTIAESSDLVLAFEIRATKAFGFAKGDPFSQTRYRF
jgi:nitroimidazol reductase NimA-like FMN-containing flavoprotein (pyridoxamine 5'-phosphate oxidase superfamily)